ncbi:MAG: hypothetical protein NZ750_04170 [Anaerolineae bacterium]|nr:hypothetical protein [Anaerolineae bacterium]MDW8171517.1 hypothetical protein [Anaerolineae bacterium]
MNSLNVPRPAVLALSIVVLQLSALMLVYSGKIESSDELQIIDAATSLARFGDWERDESASISPPRNIIDVKPLPTATYNDDPLVVLLAAGLVLLADLLPWLGVIHLVWLLNVLATASTATLLALWVRRLGYAAWIAWSVALLYGLATIALVYSRTLFREPLTALGLTACALALSHARAWPWLNWQRWAWLGAALILLSLAMQAKFTALLVAPALLAYALWPQSAWRPWGHLQILGLLLALLSLTLLAFVPPVMASLVQSSEPLLSRFGTPAPEPTKALYAYLFSPSASLWSTSPALLLALVGGWRVWRTGQQNLIWLALLALSAYALGHALLTGVHWYGGLSWPPRFLVPIVPLIAVLLAPALAWLSEPGRWLWRLGALTLIGLSLWIQVVGALSVWGAYRFQLPSESGGVAEWDGALRQLEYAHWLLLLPTWPSLGLNTAWYRAGLDGWPWAYGLLLGLSLLLSAALWRWRRAAWGILILALGWLVLTALSLRALNDSDPTTWASSESLRAAWAVLEREARPGDPLVLADPRYDRFVLNHNRLRTVRPIVFVGQPGEAGGQYAPPRLQSAFSADLLSLDYLRMLNHLALHRRRLWLLAHNGPYNSWAVRPVERYLNENFYLMREIHTGDPEVRLLEYHLEAWPPAQGLMSYEHAANLRYGDSLWLDGVTLPTGLRYGLGDTLAIALWWHTEALLSEDYQVAWFVVPSDSSRPPIQGMDSAPQGGFSPTSRWTTRTPIQDRRALVLPSDLPSGEYLLWVVVYRLSADGPERLPVTQGEALEGTVGVLPLRLTIGS